MGFDHEYVQGLELRCDDLEDFADKLITKFHYLQHNGHAWYDCTSELCIEAQILGI